MPCEARQDAGATYTCSEILFQIHAGVQTGYLIVAVEHQRGTFEKFAETPLFCLTPARMIYIWVHVGVEAVFSWSHLGPRGLRLAAGEANTHDRFAALEAGRPRDHPA